MSMEPINRRISLQGGQVHITEKNTTVYRVTDGNVLVFLIPVTDEGPGRRLLIYETSGDEVIPSFCENIGDKKWVFGLVALDKAELYEIPNSMTRELEVEFTKRTGIANQWNLDMKELLLDLYDRNNVKEEGNLYYNEIARENTREKGLRIIYDLFDKDKNRRATPESDNIIYDTVAYVCDRTNIDIAPFDKVVAVLGRRGHRVEDICRVSNFISRLVTLNDGWFKKDADSMVGFLKEGHVPVALIPIGSKGYYLYNAKTRQKLKVNEGIAMQLEKEAYALYAPFPNKELSLKELFGFGIKQTKKRDWARFLILTLLGTVIGALLPMLNQQIYDKFIPLGDASQVISIGIVILACGLGNLSFTIVKNLSALRAVTKMKNSVLAAACERVFNLSSSFYRQYTSADLAERVLSIEQIFTSISSAGMKTFIGGAFSLIYVAQMFSYSKDLAVLGIIMVMVLLGVVIYMAVQQTKYEREYLENTVESNSRMYQVLAGIQKIRSSGVEDRALLEYLKPYGEVKRINMRKERLTNVAETMTMGASGVFTVILYYKMVKSGIAISVGEFTAFMTAFGTFTAAMMELGNSMMVLNDVKPKLDRIKPILSTKAEHDEDMELPGDITGKIEISNVDFEYNKEDGKVLENFNLNIKAGEYIGIVGPSGCGKSTLLKLLLGFEKPTAGKIFYDSKDIDRMDKRELRKKFGVVLQDGSLISGSIFDNVTISARNATVADVERVIEAVGLSNDIAAMPMGLHTVLSELGGTISGGQQQRLLIARAIIGKPRMLFFDEATSALDNVTQAQVSESLDKLNITRVIIAHRLSTIRNCDRIIVMDAGKIVEEGNFDQLMAKKGIFYNLAMRQMA